MSRECRRSRSRSKSSHRYKAGRITRNPFLNFLRDFRKNNKGLKLTELTRKGAEVWRSMNNREKSPYFSQARQAPARKRKPKKLRKYKRSKVRQRKRSRSLSVTINERKNKIFPYPMDEGVRSITKEVTSGPKIIELPPDDGEASRKVDLIDLTQR